MLFRSRKENRGISISAVHPYCKLQRPAHVAMAEILEGNGDPSVPAVAPSVMPAGAPAAARLPPASDGPLDFQSVVKVFVSRARVSYKVSFGTTAPETMGSTDHRKRCHGNDAVLRM